MTTIMTTARNPDLPPAPPSPPDYRVEASLGRGERSQCSRAVLEEPGGGRRPCVIKMVELADGQDGPERLEALEALSASLEAEAGPPLVIPSAWLHPDSNRLMLLYPHLGMHPLDRIVGAGAPLTPALALQIVSGVVAALRVAWRRRVVHGNLKPSNVLLADDGQVVLIDPLPATGDARPGASPFAAPEAGPRAEICGLDVYGLGALLYYLLSAQAPRREKLETPTARLRVERGDLPRPVLSLLNALLAPDPTRRAELIEDLRLERALERTRQDLDPFRLPASANDVARRQDEQNATRRRTASLGPGPLTGADLAEAVLTDEIRALHEQLSDGGAAAEACPGELAAQGVDRLRQRRRELLARSAMTRLPSLRLARMFEALEHLLEQVHPAAASEQEGDKDRELFLLPGGVELVRSGIVASGEAEPRFEVLGRESFYVAVEQFENELGQAMVEAGMDSLEARRGLIEAVDRLRQSVIRLAARSERQLDHGQLGWHASLEGGEAVDEARQGLRRRLVQAFGAPPSLDEIEAAVDEFRTGLKSTRTGCS